MQLERRKMFEVEGGADTECMRILCHEAGHALDSAFRLHHRRRWRELFGSFTSLIPILINRRLAAATTFCILLPGTPKCILRRTSPKRLQFG
jgi:hypothetical protein